MPPLPNQEWFEMRDLRKRSLSTAVWIPLVASQVLIRRGEIGVLGHIEEYFGCVTVAVPVARKAEAEMLEWSSLSGRDHTPHNYHGHYNPVDSHEDNNGQPFGTRLVIKQHLNSHELDEWHLHQDLVVALQLKREKDSWVCPQEGYAEVARLTRDDEGEPRLLEIRAEHLRDYLCARDMGLFSSSFRSREAVLDNASSIAWPSNPLEEKTTTQLWEGSVKPLNENDPFGGGLHFMHVGRKNVDMEEDVPHYGPPGDDEVIMDSWTRDAREGRKVFMIMGELWRSDWLPPAPSSPRVREDELPASVYFITDAVGTRETKDTLTVESRWLWFRPQVMNDLSNRRGGSLRWYTRETGGIGGVPDQNIHFGLNRVGLINIYAKDIAQLPDWQQQIWSGYSVSPDGGVSNELLSSQMQAIVAETQAPEAFLKSGLDLLNTLTDKALGFRLFRPHDDYDDILSRVHRFRALDRAGLFALAKDVARLVSDSIDAASIQKHVVPPKGEKWGSHKSLEKLLASKIDPALARSLLTPLVGTYNLRLADAHLPSSETDEALAQVGINEKLPPVWQGAQLLSACVGSLYRIAEVLRNEFLTTATTPPETTN